MSTPYLSEIRLVSFNFPPNGWALCNGQTLSINQNQALFSLLGTTYGGNGTSNFQLPNLQGRVIVGWAGVNSLGQVGGVEAVSLTTAQIPNHSHTIGASLKAASSLTPAGMVPAVSALPLGNIYGSVPSSVNNVAPNNMSLSTIASVGQGQLHENRMPGLTLNYIIALLGIFPSRN